MSIAENHHWLAAGSDGGLLSTDEGKDHLRKALVPRLPEGRGLVGTFGHGCRTMHLREAEIEGGDR